MAQAVPLNPLVNVVDLYGNNGAANYNALLLGLKHPMAHHFQLDAQFQWAKSMDNSSQPYYEDPYPFNPSLAWGRSDFNVGKAFKIFGVWQPVIFTGGHTWLEKIVGGWSISGIFNIHTGFPWTPQVSTGGNLYYANSGYTTLRPAAYRGGAGHSGQTQIHRRRLRNPLCPQHGCTRNRSQQNSITHFVTEYLDTLVSCPSGS